MTSADRLFIVDTAVKDCCVGDKSNHLLNRRCNLFVGLRLIISGAIETQMVFSAHVSVKVDKISARVIKV